MKYIRFMVGAALTLSVDAASTSVTPNKERINAAAVAGKYTGRGMKGVIERVKTMQKGVTHAAKTNASLLAKIGQLTETNAQERLRQQTEIAELTRSKQVLQGKFDCQKASNVTLRKENDGFRVQILDLTKQLAGITGAHATVSTANETLKAQTQEQSAKNDQQQTQIGEITQANKALQRKLEQQIVTNGIFRKERDDFNTSVLKLTNQLVDEQVAHELVCNDFREQLAAEKTAHNSELTGARDSLTGQVGRLHEEIDQMNNDRKARQDVQLACISVLEDAGFITSVRQCSTLQDHNYFKALKSFIEGERSLLVQILETIQKFKGKRFRRYSLRRVIDQLERLLEGFSSGSLCEIAAKDTFDVIRECLEKKVQP